MQNKSAYKMIALFLGVSLVLGLTVNSTNAGVASSELMEGLEEVDAAVPSSESTSRTHNVLNNTNALTDLQPLSVTTVSGKVYDAGAEGLGSHGYPLYASIHISAPGFDKTIYSDPITGEYSIELVSETEHTFEVNSVISGYEPLVETVTPTTEAMIHDIGLGIDSEACAAPGYIGSGVNEGFESGTLPMGWVNYDYLGNGQVWQFNDPGGQGNLTPGGNGGFAIVDSDYYGPSGSQDTGLRTPVMIFLRKPV